MEQQQTNDPRCACRRTIVGRKVIISKCPIHNHHKGNGRIAFDADGFPALKTCSLCGKQFTPWDANKKRQIFCSKSCALTKHGGTKIPGYGSWKSMIGRCHNPKDHTYPKYGGRGIIVCEEWRTDFNAFISYIGPRPTPEHSVDRYPNQSGNYEPGNVRWATCKEQNRNMRTNHFVPLGTEDDPIVTDFAASEGVTIAAIRNRLKKGIPLNRPYFGTGTRLTCFVCGYSWVSLGGNPRLCSRHGCRSKGWRGPNASS